MNLPHIGANDFSIIISQYTTTTSCNKSTPNYVDQRTLSEILYLPNHVFIQENITFSKCFMQSNQERWYGIMSWMIKSKHMGSIYSSWKNLSQGHNHTKGHTPCNLSPYLKRRQLENNHTKSHNWSKSIFDTKFQQYYRL